MLPRLSPTALDGRNTLSPSTWHVGQVSHNKTWNAILTRRTPEVKCDVGEYYKQILCDPVKWIETAEALREAAEPLANVLRELLSGDTSVNSLVLHRKVHVFEMLWAYCLENLLKALIVSRRLVDKTGEQGKPRLPEEINSHDLITLAKTAGLEYLVEDYLDILAKLSQCSTWYGRYPLPVRPNDLENEKVDIWSVTNVDMRNLEVIYTSVRSELDRGAPNKQVEECGLR